MSQGPGGLVVALPEIKTPDVRLLSAWATLATVLALTALWRLVHESFQLGVLARSPKLGRLSVSEGRSPTVVAGHFTSVANAVVCLAAFFPAAEQRLSADGWSIGALFPLWSRPLSMGPPMSGTSLFYLSLAAYCLYAAFISAERILAGASSERLALLQRMLLFVLASSACMVEFVPQLSLALLLLEVPSPFVALWQALQDFRVRTDPGYGVAGGIAVVCIVKCRLLYFGVCFMMIWFHTEATTIISARPQRLFLLFLCFASLISYGVQAAYLGRDVRRAFQDAKPPAGREGILRSSPNMQV